MKMNLTKLHKVINRSSKDLTSVFSVDESFSGLLHITPSTSNDTFNVFIKNLNDVPEKTLKVMLTTLTAFDEIERLKSILNEMNKQVGIDKLMLESSFLMKKIDKLTSIKSYVSPRTNYGETNNLSLDEIKSTFTENCKSHSYNYTADFKDFFEILSKKIDELKVQKIAVDDKIAELNQTTFVEI